MITSLIAKIFGTSNERQLKRLRPIVDEINRHEPAIKQLSDGELVNQTLQFRKELSEGKTLDDLLPRAFATVREAARRVIGQRHYDVQLIGGIVLHQGKIAEMKTGEGKTLTATLALYLNALSGKTAFLVTVNDYLARRDAHWMGPIFEFLGLTVGCLQNSMNDAQRKKVYECDIVYATNNELGFDYLRDNMKFRLEDYVQHDLAFAIVDEVDSILIDEARTPLIISGASDETSKLYSQAYQAVKNLKPVEDYELDEKQRTVMLTEQGNDKVEAFFGIDNMYAIENLNILHHVTQALRANTLFKRDVDYVVHDNQVLIVDEFTGRILQGRRYSDGLHQSLEAKEGVEVERESQTLASITLQNFFRLFTKLAGMTGTAQTEAEEFHNIYKLDVVSIPTNVPMIRQDKPDLIFLTEAAKFKAIVEDVKVRHAAGQPVLIGTIAVETSERLSGVLKKEGIPHDVLNAKQHEREAEIVEHAGQAHHVTIATNMAGRGTDIKLTPEAREKGGLYILGTERHESRRIDNQLRGRSGRQGDSGESRFYISLEDQLIRVFASGSGDPYQLRNRMHAWGMTEDETIESAFLSKTIEQAQEKVEKHNFEIRKHLLEYDDVMNQHRKVIYQYRRNVLEGSHYIHELAHDMIAGAIADICAQVAQHNATLETEQIEQLLELLAKLTHLDRAVLAKQTTGTKSVERLKEALTQYVLEEYALVSSTQEGSPRAQAEKWLMLETIDQAWKQHMLNLDHLKEGINLRSWGQKNPLIEYKKEAFIMFQDMMCQIRWEIVERLFHLSPDSFDTRALERKRERELKELDLQGAAEPVSHLEPIRREEPKVGRNDECPCGSGKKYKKCCGQ